MRRCAVLAAIASVLLAGSCWWFDPPPFRAGEWESVFEESAWGDGKADALPDTNFAELKAYDTAAGVAPEQLEALDGAVVRINGYLRRADVRGRVKDFRLVGDLLRCCQVDEPAVNAVIACELGEGRSFTHEERPYRIIGEFHVEEERDEEGKVVGLYRILVEDVQHLVKR